MSEMFDQDEFIGDFPHLSDLDMQQAMQEQEQMYVEALRRVAVGTATLEDAMLLAAGCGIDFKLIT